METGDTEGKFMKEREGRGGGGERGVHKATTYGHIVFNVLEIET